MRIIGGTARGRPIKTPTGQDIRPTSDKVRLAIFNALFSRGGVVDKNIMDVFCGTGALGCEALSHGAAHCTFFDISKTSLSLAKDNVNLLGFSERANFVLKDAKTLDPCPVSGAQADVVFLDPPYRKDLVLPTLDALKKGGWMAKGAIMVIETEKECEPPSGFGPVIFDKLYGETRVTFIEGLADD